MRTKLMDVASAIGLVIMLAAAALPLAGVVADWVRWAYAAGAVVVLVARLLTPSPGTSLRVRRLHRIGIMGAVLYCLSAAVMLLPRLSPQWTVSLSLTGNEWIAFLLAGAVLQLYASVVTDRELRQQPPRTSA